MLTNFLKKIQNRSVQNHDTNGPNHGPVWKTQSFLLNEICTVILWQDYYMKGNWRKSYWSTVGRRFPIGNAYSYTLKKGYSYLCVDDIKLAGKKHNINPMWKVLKKEVDSGEPSSFLDHENLGCIQRQCEASKDIVDNYRTMFEARMSTWATEKITILGKSAYLFVVKWHGRSYTEMCRTILWVGEQNDSSMTTTPKKKKWDLQENCHKNALKLFWNAYTWHGLEDQIFYGQWVNLHDRSQKWTRACDKRLSRFISWIHHTYEYKQYCHVGNTAKQCRLGLFQDSDFARDLEDSKSTSGGTLCVFWKSYVCSNQLAVRETNFSFTQFNRFRNHFFGCRIEVRRYSRTLIYGIWSFQFFENTNQNNDRTGRPVVSTSVFYSPPHTSHKRKQSQRVINDLDNVDFILSNVKSSHQEDSLYVFEDNDAVIKMIIKGRSPTMRHVSRTHRVALDWLFDRINLDPKTPNQIHRHQKPTRKTYWQMEISHVMNGIIIFCVCWTLAIFHFYQLSWSDVEKIARRYRWRKSHRKIEADDEFGLAMQRKESYTAHGPIYHWWRWYGL